MKRTITFGTRDSLIATLLGEVLTLADERRIDLLPSLSKKTAQGIAGAASKQKRNGRLFRNVPVESGTAS